MNTPITTLLDTQNIPYRRLPHTEAVFTVEAAAQQRGVRGEEMVKSILLRDADGHYVMACVPGYAKLNPSAVRAHVPDHWRRLTFASAHEITHVTGYVMGAVAPLCLPDEIPVVFDISLAHLARVNISSGDPMLGLELAGADLIRLSGAILAPITK